ncbi:hypothetical protein [Mycolicibacterium sp.]|uniref:hypothetical protein n=1 Tax=Mycolicibacterium sp. TaxID=2320850 RepID=UPI0025F9F0C0|nr:hypothetical protein [Mycolicibacterium sp.]
MTESPESTTVVSPVTTAEDVHRNNRLYRALAWVGIVAGILFIIAVVFFSGFFAARASGGYGWHRGSQSGQMQPGGTMGGGCPMMQMQPGGMGGMGQGGMGQGGMAPGGMPGGMGPGMMPGMGPGGMTGPTPGSTTTTPPSAGQR